MRNEYKRQLPEILVSSHEYSSSAINGLTRTFPN